ncbi:MAG TPA: AMP-binding protein [Steroidobacteraceae bacterium]|nr:AMP-binding protein [Steroidobacteraceae bacterium]
MQKIWLKSYPPGVPAQIDRNAIRSLREMAEESFARFAERPAFSQMGRAMSFRELEEHSRAFGAWLQKESGLKRGDRLAIMLPNVLQYPIAMFGALRAGMTVVNTNPLYTARELEHQLNDSGASAIVVLENFAHVVTEVLPRTKLKWVLVTSVGAWLGFPKSRIVDFVVRRVRKQVPAWRIERALDFRSVVRSGRGLQLDPVELGHEDIAFLQYTGGTTGISKGAVLTHGNICANILQAEAWIRPFLPPPQSAQSVLVTPIPLYHIFALTANCMLFLRLGWHNVLITNPRDLPAFVAELRRYPFAYLSGVNTLFNALLNTQGFERLDFSHLKITLGGGMAVQSSVAERWKAVTGKPLSQAWGLTETSPGVCINPPGEDFNGSIGLPIPSSEVSIKDDSGRDLAVNEVGEICVRGPQVMRGYWNRPDETAKVMLPEGWLRTGDIGRMDERGYVYIQDRKKDMILVSGFNVYPNEVEEVAAAHPGILEVAAVAQPDEHSGEVVALFVVRKDPKLTEKEIIEFCRKSLTAYKVPKHVFFRDELPKTNVGKILRRALRDEFTPHA